EAWKHALDLQGALDAEPADPVRLRAGDVVAEEKDAAGARRQQPGNEVEERGLAGAVRADDGVQARARKGKAEIVHGGQAAEALGQPLGAEDRLAHGSVRSSGAPDCRSRRSVRRAIHSFHSPTTPRGANITTRIATAPTISEWCSQCVETTSR